MKPLELRIRTPEGIVFAYPLAGPITRSLAWAIDGAVLIALVFTVSTGLGMLGAISRDFSEALAAILIFVLSFGYSIVLEWFWRGQTVGKKMMRLRVMDADGLRLQFHQVLMRNLVRFADILPGFYLVGGVTSLLSRKAQRLGDIAAGTIVVHHRQPAEPDLEQLLGGKFNSLRAHLHLCARIRQRTSPEEASLVLQALIRRDEFEPADRVKLFTELADHFKGLVGFPPELLESMPDEQFLRNIVDILFRTGSAKSAQPAREAAAAVPA